MSPNSYPHLFSKLERGVFRLKNRIVHAAMSTRYVEGGRVTEELISYHANRARGGAAMTVTEPMNVLARHSNSRKVDVYSGKNGEALRRWAAAVEKYDCRLIGQIQDPGRGRHEQGRNAAAIGPSALPDDLSWTVPYVPSTAEVEQLVEEFTHSAKLLKDAGFGGVEISAGHGHLFHQFLSSWSNHRTDKYGGDIANRARLLTELVSSIRASCGGDFIIGVKLPAEDGQAGGIDFVQAEQITRIVHKTSSIDYLTYCWGAHSNTLDTHLPDLHGKRAPYVDTIARLAASAPGVVVGALGLITDPNEGERIIRDGQADIIMLGRPLVTDAAWGVKAQEGREAEIRYCVSCNTCWQVIVSGNKIQCDNNPRVGASDEADWRPAPAEKKKRIVVVGGGIAGMEAAWVAAARGHDVTVFNSSSESGGKTRLHAALPGGEGLSSIYDYQRLSADRFGAKLEFNVRVVSDEILALRPDAVILATGSTMRWPDFIPQEYKADGLFPDLRAVIADLLGRHDRQKGTVVIYDHDHTAMTYAAAEFLHQRYERVVIVTPRERIAADESLVNRLGIYRRLEQKRIRTLTLSTVSEQSRFEEGVVVCRNVYNGDETAIDDVSLLTYSTPRLPNDAMAESIRKAGVSLHLIGDCFAPRFVVNATADGHKIGCSL